MKTILRSKEELIRLRGDYLPYEESVKVLNELIAIYKREYKPQHTSAQYYKLIRDWDIDAVEKRHPQDTNFPDKVYECFSIVSQHVYGYTKEHCYDQIWDGVVRKKERIALYKTLPTLKELVESDTPIDPDKVYQTKEKDTYEDSCSGYGGENILRMREIGIDAYNEEQWNKRLDFLTRGMTKKDWYDISKQLRIKYIPQSLAD